MIKSAREIQLSVSTDIFGFPLRRDSHNNMNSSTVHYAVLADSNVWVCGWNPKSEHLTETSSVVLSNGAVSFHNFGKTNLWYKIILNEILFLDASLDCQKG